MRSPPGGQARVLRGLRCRTCSGRRMIRHSARLLAALLALILLWAPLPFGGVTPWAGALLAGARLRRPRPRRGGARAPAGAAAGGAAGRAPSPPWPCSPWLQAAPLPAGLVAVLSPRARGARAAGGGAGGAGAGAADARRRGDARGRPSAGRRRRRPSSPPRSPASGASTGAGWPRRCSPARSSRSSSAPATGSPARGRSGGSTCTPRPCACAAPSSIPTIWRPTWRWRSPSPSPGAGGRRAGRATSRGSSAGCCWRRRRSMLWLTLFAGLSFTGSRGGLLAAVAAVSVQGVLAAGRRRRWWTAPLGAAGGARRDPRR